MTDLALHLIAAGIRPKMMPLFRRLARSTVYVEHPTPNGCNTGTGIILAVDPTIILTAAHVAAAGGQDPSLIKRMGFDRKTASPKPIGSGRLAELVWFDRQCDLAILTFPNGLPNTRPARLGKDRLKIKTPLYRLGNDNIGMASGYFLTRADHEGWPELVASTYNDIGGSGGPLAVKGPVVVGIVLRIPSDPRVSPQTLALPIERAIARLMDEPEMRPCLEGRVIIE